jgi:hypothetical protein
MISVILIPATDTLRKFWITLSKARDITAVIS